MQQKGIHRSFLKLERTRLKQGKGFGNIGLAVGVVGVEHIGWALHFVEVDHKF